MAKNKTVSVSELHDLIKKGTIKYDFQSLKKNDATLNAVFKKLSIGDTFKPVVVDKNKTVDAEAAKGVSYLLDIVANPTKNISGMVGKAASTMVDLEYQ